MKKILLVVAVMTLIFTGCKKRTDVIRFEGVVVDGYNCTMQTASISEMDYGYVVALSTPDSIGAQYKSSNGNTYPHCVLMYRTKYRFKEQETISGTMYLDDDYDDAYCTYHYDNLGLPEAVCYTLD